MLGNAGIQQAGADRPGPRRAHKADHLLEPTGLERFDVVVHEEQEVASRQPGALVVAVGERDVLLVLDELHLEGSVKRPDELYRAVSGAVIYQDYLEVGVVGVLS